MESACSLSSTQRMVRLGFIAVSEWRMSSGVAAGGIRKLFVARATCILMPRIAAVKCRRCQWQISPIEFFLGLCSACVFSAVERENSKENFAAQHLDRISTDTHINHSITDARGAHENPAGSVHLDALLDKNALVRISNLMRDHPCRCASRRRPGGRVLAV